MKDVYRKVISLIMIILIGSSIILMIPPSDGEEFDGEVFITIHRIQAHDDLDPWGGGEAEWYYYIGFRENDGDWSWQESQIPIASDQDDVTVDRVHGFQVSSSIVEFTIILCEEDLSEDGTADISEDVADLGQKDFIDNGDQPIPKPLSGEYLLGSYKGEWDLETEALTPNSERTDLDGEYFLTSGNFDGSTVADNNDASVWFAIDSTYETMGPGTDDDPGIELTDSRKGDLAERFHPILLFDSEEEIFPTGVEYHLDNSMLFPNDGSGSSYGPPVTWMHLDSITNEEAYIDNIEDEVVDDYHEEREIYGDVVYSHVTVSSYNGIEYISVQYWFFYAFNDWLNNHEGDWETITILLDRDEDIKFAAYSQHHDKETMNTDDIEISGERVKVYIAKGSHANYFRAGTSSVGDTMDGSNGFSLERDNSNLIMLDDTGSDIYLKTWLDYPGLWGDHSILPESSGPPGPKYRFDGKCWSEPATWVLEEYDGPILVDEDDTEPDEEVPLLDLSIILLILTILIGVIQTRKRDL